MTRFKLIACGIASALFLHSCSQILEPISLFGTGSDGEAAAQEEFAVNVESLTFKSAQKANKDPYPRQLMLTGSGSRADVFYEADILTSNIPQSLESAEYLLGIGDEMALNQLNEFMNEVAQWPAVSLEAEYLLGVGDELAFIQLNETAGKIEFAFDALDKTTTSENQETEAKVLQTSGIIGSNGNILLLGVGSIKAVDRTLDDVRTEVRNILIRNGLAPNFQLEITNFLSKKSYVNVTNGASEIVPLTGASEIVPLTNIPVSIKEIVLRSGLTGSSKSLSLITLTRNGKTFRITAGQLFDLNAPEIWIMDKDQIEINISPSASSQTVASVGSRGNILLPGIGSIKAVNRTLDDVRNEVHKLLIKKGLLPSFQLELTGFKSKKAYFIEKKNGSKTVPLGNTKITLKELIINSRKKVPSPDGIVLITFTRNEEVFRMTWDQIVDPGTPDIWVRDQDQVELESLSYKPGQVFAISGAGNAKMVPIDPSKRETLADILFTEDGALSNVLAKRSEVYLLRGRNPSVAYHLDAQNVSRILVAAKTELRPNDIVFVADRPIVSFARALGELSPLQMLLRDIRTDNLP